LEGLIYDYSHEIFTFRIHYKDGKMKFFHFEPDAVHSSLYYKLLNPPLDYERIEEFLKTGTSN